MMTTRTFAILSYCLLLFISSSVAFCQEEGVDENRVRKLAHQLRCPTCQSQSVKDSDAGLSLNMKTKIRSLIKEEKSDGEILDYFVERYGEWILRSPKKSGFSLLLWIMPVIVMTIATIVLLLSLKQKKLKANIPEHEEALSKSEDKEISKQFEQIFKK